MILVAAVSSSLGKLLSNKIFMSISLRMHNNMVKSCINTDLVYFEENTCGRIMNRFSKDVKTLDNFLFTFIEMTDYAVKCFFSTVIVIYLFPGLIVVAAIQLFYIWRLRYLCMFATRDTIRLKYSLMSPVNSLIQDAINGLPTLKCMD
jgi:ABC-type multidrug transport system fused ATPase/permease subunit